MKHLVKPPLQAIDAALADRICQWFNTEDELLWQTIAATSFALQQGHSCLSLTQAKHNAPYNQSGDSKVFDFPSVERWQQQLARFNLTEPSNSPIILEADRVYLRRYWQFEQELANFVNQRMAQESTLDKSKLARAKKLLADYFPANDNQIDWQKIAASNSLFNNFNIIIGGPGTGKTYTVTRILALLASLFDHPPIIKLAAPTGKAAQRLAESIRQAKQAMPLDLLIADAIPSEAMTLHRLLGVIPNQLQFRHNEQNPIEADILLIDEVSMVDLPLMTRLCRAIKPTTRLILLGDADQLPSVATGSILADLVQKPHQGYSAKRCQQLNQLDASFKLTTSNEPQDHVTELKHSRRFDDGSGIGVLAKAVIQGQRKTGLSAFAQHDDIHWVPDSGFEQQLNAWVNQYFKPINHANDLAEAFARLGEFRILCATREGKRGVETLNTRISKRFNTNLQPFYRGQPIMVTQNHYGLSLYNGDIGLVWPNKDGDLMAWFEEQGRYREVALGRLPAVETVYAMTIHKTQGSEFSHVGMLLPDAITPLLTRELIYTGLTRAKKSFTALGNEQIWQQGVGALVKRWAGLAEKLKTEN